MIGSAAVVIRFILRAFMLLNRVEFTLMNNPLRAVSQRRFEARRLLRMGGPIVGGHVLEIGCGRGIGVQIIFDLFGASSVDAFDLDPRMVARASRRIRKAGQAAGLWVGDCTAIPAKDGTYDAVFDFGIIHHVPDWRGALCEVARLLKPGGRFYAEEALGFFITHPLTRMVLAHPRADRFDAPEFGAAIVDVGLVRDSTESLLKSFGWFIAHKPAGRASVSSA